MISYRSEVESNGWRLHAVATHGFLAHAVGDPASATGDLRSCGVAMPIWKRWSSARGASGREGVCTWGVGERSRQLPHPRSRRASGVIAPTVPYSSVCGRRFPTRPDLTRRFFFSRTEQNGARDGIEPGPSLRVAGARAWEMEEYHTRSQPLDVSEKEREH